MKTDFQAQKRIMLSIISSSSVSYLMLLKKKCPESESVALLAFHSKNLWVNHRGVMVSVQDWLVLGKKKERSESWLSWPLPDISLSWYLYIQEIPYFLVDNVISSHYLSVQHLFKILRRIYKLITLKIQRVWSMAYLCQLCYNIYVPLWNIQLSEHLEDYARCPAWPLEYSDYHRYFVVWA